MLLYDIIELRRLVDDHFRKADLSTTRHQLLVALDGKPEGCTQTTLVTLTGIDRSTTAQTIRLMADNGLVTRQRMEDDERKKNVQITPKGRIYLKQSTKVAEQVERLIERVRPARRGPFIEAISDILKPDATTAGG